MAPVAVGLFRTGCKMRGFQHATKGEKGHETLLHSILSCSFFASLATGYKPKARLIPLAVSIAGILLGLQLLVNELLRVRMIGGAAGSLPPRAEESSQAGELQKILLRFSAFDDGLLQLIKCR